MFELDCHFRSNVLCVSKHIYIYIYVCASVCVYVYACADMNNSGK